MLTDWFMIGEQLGGWHPYLSPSVASPGSETMQRIGGVAGAPGRESLSLIFSAGAEQRPHGRVLLFVAPPGSISDAMIAAIEREFSWISVRHVQDVQMACMPFDLEVQLILVDRGLVRALQPWLAQLARVHPYASAAVTAEARSDCSDDLTRIIATGVVRGVLPMDVNLDIWLSIIRIMLKGGEYFPSALFQKLQRLREVDNAGGAPPMQNPEPGQAEQWSETMDGLTGRELEVLAKVARGHQNKIIAADLGLSEHTVKIHLHNIIRKLGVHNRTEAAAKYFERASNQEEADDDASERDIAAGTDTPSAA